ncbi:uncharacterized protein LOC120711862 isoform X2 [Panicum virgatum]|uniref:uncharacterized protein LOC120711862 isoform X2 n=1 Tax=Panicum virgatum TaxID=38727 RepID=UPI0019D63FEC|nr:uncharacterized protein LOC120711862 isoform X2 [Panicum virgatum]
MKPVLMRRKSKGMTKNPYRHKPGVLPRAEEQTATGSATGLRVLPIGARFALATDLVDDPQLTPETLKKFQDSMKECYKFASEMANRSYTKSQKLKATVDVDRIIQEKERQIGEKMMEYVEIHNQLHTVQKESAREIWQLKKDIGNLKKDKSLEERNQSLEDKNKEMRKKHPELTDISI